MRGFLPQANCVCKFEHSGSAELARNRDVFIFRAALSENGEDAAKRARGHLLRIFSGITKNSQEGNNRGKRIRWRFKFGLYHLGWKSEDQNKRWMDGGYLCVCVWTYAGQLKIEELVGLNEIDYN